MKTIIILALTLATIAPAAHADEPVTVIFDGKPQEVLITARHHDGIVVATSTGERKLKDGEYLVQALPAPRTPTPRTPAPRQPTPRVPAPRTPAPRVPAPRMDEDLADIRQDLHDIRTWMILEEARKRGISIAIYR